MAGHGVVDAGGDALVLEEGGELVTLRRPDDVEMVYVPCTCGFGGQLDGPTAERRLVAGGERAAPIVHGVEPPQEDAPDRGLDLVEAQVEADLEVHVLFLPTVVAEPAAARRHLVIVRDEHAPVTHHGKVLRGIEGEYPGAAERSDLPALPGRPVRLGAILQEPQIVPQAELLDLAKIGGMAVEVHRDE